MKKSNPDLVRRFFTGTSSTYDLVVKLFTYGADLYWKRKLLAGVPPSQNILDLACGTGIVSFKLARAHAQARIIGVDVTEEYLRAAKAKMARNGALPVHFICARAEQVHLRASFDCILSSYIPKYVPAAELLENITPFLNRGGSLLLHDFALPTNRFYRALWEGHMRLMKWVGPMLFPQWNIVFRELAELVRTTRWIAEYEEALKRFGYTDIHVERLTAGSSAIISAVKARESSQAADRNSRRVYQDTHFAL